MAVYSGSSSSFMLRQKMRISRDEYIDLSYDLRMKILKAK